MKTPTPTSVAKQAAKVQAIRRLAVGVNGYPEGLDAAALGGAISRATDAAMMLVAVHPNPMIVVPEGLDWKSLHEQARETLIATREEFAPESRTVVRTDHSVARALHRVVQDEHRDLLVVGSSRHAAPGHVRIGKRTRQLLCNFECALAVAPRGLHDRGDFAFKRIGVGYDGGPESRAALAWAGAVALGSGAELCVRGVVDSRMPTVGWGQVWIGHMMRDWMGVVNEEKNSLRSQAEAVAGQAGLCVDVDVVSGRPADAMLALSGEVDLMVIGSRRWGPGKRLLLGSTGEALMHDAACAVVAVPRPET
ncbi:MAG: universal stress protein [Solirubrobacteraceae bacterium]